MSLLSLGISYAAHANPQGGQVADGAATIASSGSKLDVHQQSDRVVIDWRGFDIGVNEHTQFHQPSAGATALNRVNSSNPSQIMGKLTANGNIVLVNPNGVFFGKNSRVDVNGLIATTADIDTKNFMAGKLHFNKPGNPNAAIVNEGNITARQAGLVGLVAPNVLNNGVIKAKLGKVHLASGDSVTVDLYGDGLLELKLSDKVKQQLVSNHGLIAAEGGTITLSAAAGKQIINSLVEVKGELHAPSIEQKNGRIIIGAGDGTAEISGTLEATGLQSGQTGGHIEVTGKTVTVKSGALIDASGHSGGGEILVGGDYQGKGTTPRADKTTIEKGATLKANATVKGDGGKVIVWADGETDFHGKIEAKGGPLGGKGGFVETSGKKILTSTGTVDASAAQGMGGQWLLDPTNVTISGGGLEDLTAGGPNTTGSINASTIQAALNNGTSVTVTTDIGGGQSGDITLASVSISKTAGGSATLALLANQDILTTGTNTITTSSGNNTLYMAAGRNILLSSTALSSGSGALSVVLNADADGLNNGAIRLTSSAITTNGGEVILSGGDTRAAATVLADLSYLRNTGRAWGVSGEIEGVELNNTDILTTTGNVTLRGHGWNDAATSYIYGVYLANGGDSIISTGTGGSAGNITLDGIGGNGSQRNHGVYTTIGSAITSRDGDISLTALGNGSSAVGMGMDLNGVITSNGTGADAANITIMSTGATNNAGTNTGLRINTAAIIQTIDGDISITGIGKASGGVGTTNYGVWFDGGKSLSTGDGNITLNGTGGSGQGTNYGVILQGSTALVTVLKGAINITGQGVGSGNSNSGIYLLGGADVTSTGTGVDAGTITMNGTGGNGGTLNHGVFITGSGTTVNSARGAVSITGTGGAGTGNSNTGVQMDTSALVTAANGSILITGQGGGSGGTSTGNYGVSMASSADVTSTGTGANAASITFLGTGGNTASGGNHGINTTTAGTTITSVDGDISLTGIGGATGNTNIGVYHTATTLSSTGTGADAAKITIDGTGYGASTGVGVYFVTSSAINSVDGDISMTGRANINGQEGVWFNTATTVNLTGAADFTVAGLSGGVGTGTGVRFSTNTTNNIIGSATATGDISIITNNLNFAATTVQNSGSLTFKPYTEPTTIGVSGGTGTLQITDALLANFTGFNRLIIGDSLDGGGAVDVDSLDFSTALYSNMRGFEVYGGSLDIDTITGATNMDMYFGASGLNASTGVVDLDSLGLINNDGVNRTFYVRSAASTLMSGSALFSSSGALRAVINADSDGNSTGAIRLTSTAFTTLGGEVILSGGNSGQTALSANDLTYLRGTGYAWGVTGEIEGIELNNSDITATTGNITLRGHGWNNASASNYGIYVWNGSNIVSQGTGATAGSITLNGVGGNGTNSNRGISIADASTNLSSIDGDIWITGQGGIAATGANNTGLGISGDADILTSGDADITLEGVVGNAGDNLVLSAPTLLTLGGPTATGDITIIADGQKISGTDARTSGTLTFKPKTPSYSLAVSASVSAVTLNDTVLGQFSGFSKLVIGDSVAGSGTISVDSWDLSAANFANMRELEIYGGALTFAVGGITNSTNMDMILSASGLSGSTGIASIGGLNLTNNDGVNRSIYITSAATTTLGSGVINATSGAVDIIINADRNADSSGAISMSNSTLTPNGGEVILSGGDNRDAATVLGDLAFLRTTGRAWGVSGTKNGVNLNNTDITTTTGDITLRGHGWNDASLQNRGVVLGGDSDLVSTDTGAGAGIITLDGIGGDGTSQNVGVEINGSTSSIDSAKGVISITGVAGAGSSTANNGVGISGLVTAVDGSISITGTGRSNGAADSNKGISISSGGSINSTGTGIGAATIILHGTGGNGTNANSGVHVDSASSNITSARGAIGITGIGGAGSTANNYGVYLSNNAQISAVDGSITLTGTGGGTAAAGSNSNHGIHLLSGPDIISSGNATITLTGTGGAAGGDGNNGVYIRDSGTSLSSIGGDISITGIGGGTGASINNTGVYLYVDADITTTGAADVTIDSTKGLGTSTSLRVSGATVTIGGGTAMGDFTFIQDDWSLANLAAQTSGTLTIKPKTEPTSLGVSGGTGTLDLSDANLAFFSGFSKLVIGDSADGGGAVDIDSWALNAANFSNMRNLEVWGGKIDVDDISNAVNMGMKFGSLDSSSASAGTVDIDSLSLVNNDATTRDFYIASASNTILTNSTLNATNGGIRTVINADKVQGRGGITVSGTVINSLAGEVILSGGNSGQTALSAADLTWLRNNGITQGIGSGGYHEGIDLNNTQITTSTGGMTLRGTAYTANSGIFTDRYGVYLRSGTALNSTGTGGSAGAITIYGNGTSNTNTSTSYGVYLTGSTTAINTADGAVSITGRGGNNGNASNYGMFMELGADINSTGTGANAGTITLNGTGGNGSTDNYGVYATGVGTTVTSTNGAINITGTAGSGSSTGNSGVVMDNSALVTAVNGSIGITGAGRSQNSNGINLDTGASITSTGTTANAATITVNGSNTGASSGLGVRLNSATTSITSGYGAIDITGSSGASGSAERGIQLTSGADIISTGTFAAALPGAAPATITLRGTGGGVSNTNIGIYMLNTGTSIAAVDGDVSLIGIGGPNGAGTDNNGIYLTSDADILLSGAAKLTLDATKGGGTSSGIKTSGATISIGGASATGDITFITNDWSLANLDVKTSGTLTIKPKTEPTDIGVSGGAGTLQLDDTTLGYFSGFSKLVIGDSVDAGGAIDIDSWDLTAANFSNMASLELYGGSFDVDGMTATNKNILVSASGLNASTGVVDIDALSLTNNDATTRDFYIASTATTILSNSTINATNGGIRTIVNADRDANSAGAIRLTSTNITNRAGEVILSGGDNRAAATVLGDLATLRTTGRAWGVTGEVEGIELNGSDITTTTGNITLRGNGWNNASANNYGVYLLGDTDLTSSGSGTITINGTGGAGTDGNHGFLITGSAATISSQGAAIDITGTGKGTGSTNRGAQVDAAAKISSTSGAISFTGYGSTTGSDTSNGVNFNSAPQAISTQTGLITITGVGGNNSGSNNHGVTFHSNSSIISSGAAGAGDIILNGTAGAGPSVNYGVNFQSGNISTVSGDLSITGRGGDNGTNYGIYLWNTFDLISTGTGADAGNISLNGTGGNGAQTNFGVWLRGGSGSEISVVDGDISITGQGGNGTYNNFGVYMSQGYAINVTSTSADVGSITVQGTGGTGSYSNYGIYMTGSGTSIISALGAIDITGTGGLGTSTGNNGVQLDTSALITAVNGSIDITGTGRSTGAAANNYGVYLAVGADITSTGTTAGTAATIDITGTGGNGTSGNTGIYLYDSGTTITSAAGDIGLTGTGGNGSSTGNLGMFIANQSSITSTGTASNAANIHLTGTGTGASSTGVYMLHSGTVLSTIDGDILIEGTGGNSNASNHGFYMASADIYSTGTLAGAGTITIDGTGGNGTGADRGVYLDGAGTTINSVKGNIGITGQGGGGSNSDKYGIQLAGASVISTGTGVGAATITLNGTGGAAAGSRQYGVYLTGAGTNITSVDGDVSVMGAGGTTGAINTNHGVYLNTDADILLTGSADLLIDAVKGAGTSNAFITSGATVTIGGGTATGNFIFNTNDIDLANASVQTSGLVTLKAKTANTAMNVGSGAAATGLSLDDTELGYINAGSIVIGDSATSGDVHINTAHSFGEKVTFIGGLTKDLYLDAVLVSTAAGDSLVLVAGDDFINAAGASGLSASNGRWLVYSADPAGNTRDGLLPTASEFGKTYALNAPATIGAGNRFVYATSTRPTIALDVDDDNVTYGDAYSGGSYSYLSGLLAGDTLGTIGLSGAASYSTPYTAGSSVAGGPYAINGAAGTLASVLGYDFSFNAGALTVDKRALTATVNSPAAQTYGDLAPTLTKTGDVTWGNLYTGDSGADLDSVTFTYGGATAGVKNNAGSYTLGVGAFSDDNYSLDLMNDVTGGTLLVNKKGLTVTLLDTAPTRVANEPDPAFGLGYSGFVPGEGIGDIDVLPTAGIAAPNTAASGLHDILIAGGSDNNYDLNYTNPAGVLTVTEVPAAAPAPVAPLPPEVPPAPEPPVDPVDPADPVDPVTPVDPQQPPAAPLSENELPSTVVRTSQDPLTSNIVFATDNAGSAETSDSAENAQSTDEFSLDRKKEDEDLHRTSKKSRAKYKKALGGLVNIHPALVRLFRLGEQGRL